MSRSIMALAFLAVYLATGLARADELLARSMENLPGEVGENCSYTSTRTVDGGLVEAMRYQPTRPHWMLLTVDGREPTEDERDGFEPPDVRGHPAAMDVRAMGTEHTRISTDDGQAVYTFTPLGENGKPIDEAVQGTLTIDEESAMMTRQVMRATQPFSPSIVVKFTEFNQDIEFAYDDHVGGVVVKHMAFHIRGRAMGLKKIDRQVEIEFSDYDCTRRSPAPQGENSIQ